mmetsp:Transcript_7756/g.15576  ORF Transcript_7756/g.15576 Transcript_7756/m.15576 type:complete len:771 (+) Transcript_7756:890-3202(+)
MKLVHLDGESLATGLATTIVEASVEDCAAYAVLQYNSRDAKRRLKHILKATVEKINDHSHNYISTRQLGFFLSDREMRSRIIWKKEEDGKVVVDINDAYKTLKRFPIREGNVLVSGHAVWIFRPIDPIQAIGERILTEATLTTRVDLGGNIPSRAMQFLGKRFLSQVSDLRKWVDKKEDILSDKTEEDDDSSKKEKKRHDNLAPKNSNNNNKKHKNRLEMEVKLLEKKNKKGGKVQREFLSTMRLHKIDNKTIAITTNPLVKNDRKNKRKSSLLSKNMLGQETTSIKISKIEKNTSKLEIITKLKLGPNAKNKEVIESLEKHLNTATDSSIFFMNLIGSKKVALDEGKMIGEQLMLRVRRRNKTKGKEEEVKQFIRENKALKEVAEEYPFFEPMLCAIVESSLKGSKVVKKKAECLEAKDGQTIGESLALFMATTLTGKHAIDEWSLQYPAVIEVFSEHLWLKPMLEAIAFKLIGDVGWGVKARVGIGALTSILDLVTDIYVTNMYWKDETQQGYFQASLASLSVSMVLQLWMTYAQYIKIGWVRVLRECLTIFTGFKPAVDAYRVASGEKQKKGQKVDPMFELTGMKCIEMFAEAIPGVVIQLMAIATIGKDENGDQREVALSAWISLAVSAVSTGFISASISYDYDTNPEKRQQTPDFYGYIPAQASKRTAIFGTMVFFSAGMLLIRCTTIVLLGVIGKRWAFVYIGADVGLYLVIKMLRGDFWYWVPLGGNAEIVSSIVARVLVKIVTDFTSIVRDIVDVCFFHHQY